MVAFVKETEPLLERGQGQVIRPDESMSAVQYLLRDIFFIYVLISILCTVQAENLLALMVTFVVVFKTSATPTIASRATRTPRDTPHNELYVFGLSLISCFHLERIQQLVRGFASDWKRSIENINQEIMRSFSNFKNGTTILQVSRSQRVATRKVN